ncbi:hypothetical protein A3C98_03190 [Candidatus Roizmanbacteria bacterium RIFCSPHIGHO2_02_FULL_37_15]|uniref:Uncharacterized protein n=1 Tax=Candidatus Roizmanbacteria bacterium RIFCSPLOWO2_01_FULL_37_16 TaxID=1802058 RepID=A0A1F7IQ10_9BACT|nr:MAG: hypothetical protein A2859_00030 [Candidatus Roizmanbacteria bacterium RIFCSPHIGHO2_01_FULL_37_16b]OGK22236.1 MAG: hypothetical protein A3C98_03190 [Candidatus Roizmanbacteria bacterium RIFCSPHIGHO2_02_FULL_37_15]OGK31668.1 MAG: hypothetical protein A3F57_02630 [Candidatus Roizmanbacteria bacterium RIFCSPHIGHO2_12_FULL_36_11]OGK45453.1 MAG: hypothetical protein A3B40_06000 [Candidatus Roizmanbacteria bacterium RIFCSPLOWO2_01_FULL_37_16]
MLAKKNYLRHKSFVLDEVGATLITTIFTFLAATNLVIPLFTPPTTDQTVSYESITPGRYLICSMPTPTPTLIVTIIPTFTPTPTPTLLPTEIPSSTPIPSITPTPTVSLAETCQVGANTIKKGEGLCDEKSNTVTVCEGNNQMVQKQNFCGQGQVCLSQAGNFQIKCNAACQLKLGTGARTKADLVVLAEDFNSYSDFLRNVDKEVAALNQTNLGAARLGKINLWALLDLNQTYFLGYNCPITGGSVVACWDHIKAITTAMSSCGGDTYSILNNDTHRVGSVGGIAIWGGNYLFKFALDFPTFPHELGHSMAGLVDEYSFGIAAPSGAIAGINCSEKASQSETTPCPKWATRFPSVGCYKRCGYTNFYRPTIRSIMDRGGTGAVYDFNEPSLVDGWDDILKYFQ